MKDLFFGLVTALVVLLCVAISLWIPKAISQLYDIWKRDPLYHYLSYDSFQSWYVLFPDRWILYDAGEKPGHSKAFCQYKLNDRKLPSFYFSGFDYLKFMRFVQKQKKHEKEIARRAKEQAFYTEFLSSIRCNIEQANIKHEEYIQEKLKGIQKQDKGQNIK